MNVGKFGKRLVLALVATTTMLVGLPASQAASASSALCSATGNRFDSQFSVYDLNCATGSADFLGAWHLQDNNGAVTGVGPHGESVTGTTTAIPICVTVGGMIRYCRTVKLTVCIDNWCRTVTLYICITYRVPQVTVCVETANSGLFDGDAIFDGTDTAAQGPSTSSGTTRAPGVRQHARL